MSRVYVNIVGKKLILSFDRSDHTIEKLRTIPGARFNKGYARWEIPVSSYPKLVSTLDNLTISTGVMEYLSREAQLRRDIAELRTCPTYEIEDYVPKLPFFNHQKKLFQLHRMCEGSGNFSEVGTGKTFPAICSIHWRKLMRQVNHCLIVCPLSVLKQWMEEIDTFSNLTHIALVGNKKQRLKALEANRDVYLINYEGARLITSELIGKGFDMVICDEAHRIKNPMTKQAKAVYSIGDLAQFRIALTGTPVLNTPLDAFGVMRFIDSSIFGDSFYAFRSKYFINAAGNSPFQIWVPRAGAEEEISDKLYLRSMRYLKEECLDLPPAITVPTKIITLSPEQDKAYKDMQEHLFCQINEDKTIKISHALTLLMKLNQITSGWLKDPKSDDIIFFKNNPKFQELLSTMEELKGKPVILWAYYTVDVNLLYEYFSRCQKCKQKVNDVSEDSCPKCGTKIIYRASQVQGSTKNRELEINRFRFPSYPDSTQLSPAGGQMKSRSEMRQVLLDNKEAPEVIKAKLGDLLPNGMELPQTNVFVGQISAASEGLNLQRATYSIYYSRDYSLKNHLQSLGRNHRGGQRQTVTYINLACCRANGEDTVDMRVLDALNRKEHMSKKINKDDLKFLLGKKAEDILLNDDSDDSGETATDTTADEGADVVIPTDNLKSEEDEIDTSGPSEESEKTLF